MSLLKTVAVRFKELTKEAQNRQWDGLEDRFQSALSPLSNRLEFLASKLDQVQQEVGHIKNLDSGSDVRRRLESIADDIESIGRNLNETGSKLERIQGVEELIQSLREESRSFERTRHDHQKQLVEQLGQLDDGQSRMRNGLESLSGSLEQLREDVTGRFVADLLPFADILEETLASGKRLLDRIPAESRVRRRFFLFGRRSDGAQSSWDEVAGWLRGISLLKGRLQKLIVDAGAVPIDSIGKPFDPSRHVAVETVRGQGDDRNLVVAERLRGYLFGGKVLRFSRVVVAK
ncbi:MAG: nucleotide exchange factor GrpE [Planctomycetota bacterium]